MLYERQNGVPRFTCTEYRERSREYVVLIPIINEGDRIIKELKRAAYGNLVGIRERLSGYYHYRRQ